MPRRDRNNISRYWHHRHVAGLSLMHADFKTQEYAPHWHDALVIAVTETGGSVIKTRGVTDQAHARVLFVFNPAEPHAGWMGASPHWRYRAFYLERAAMDDIARTLGLKDLPYFTQNTIFDRGLIETFLSLHRALEDDGDGDHARERLVATFGAMFRRHGDGVRLEPGPRDRAKVDRLVDLIRANLAERLNLDRLCRAVELTEYQLIHLFKRVTGLTPHSYIVQARLNEASRHLVEGSPIADAALAAGFYDQSALTRHFKSCYGVTPRQFARAVRA